MFIKLVWYRWSACVDGQQSNNVRVNQRASTLNYSKLRDGSLGYADPCLNLGEIQKS